MRIVGFLYIVAVGTVLACDRGMARDGAATVRDSAGITIVENTGAEGALAAWTVEAAPVVEIGVADGAATDQLYGVTGARRTPDGSLIVANGGTLEVRVYDPAGAFVRSWGRGGEGPGEFRSLDGVSLIGDTIYAFDLDLRRANTFTSAGEHIATIRFAEQGVIPLGPPIVMSDRTFVVAWMVGDPFTLFDRGEANVGQVVRTQAMLVRYAPTGAVLDTIGSFPGFEEALVSRQGRLSSTRAPFAHAFSFDARNDELFVGTQDRFEVAVLSPAGAVIRLIRAPTPDLTITPARLDTLKRQVRRNFPAPEVAAAIAQRIDETPRPDHAPAYGRLLVDAAGNLWISEYSFVPITPLAWRVFDHAGNELARASLPERFQVFEIGTDYVLGVWRDELDVEQVRMHRLVKPQ
jgi:hypothetical protein